MLFKSTYLTLLLLFLYQNTIAQTVTTIARNTSIDDGLVLDAQGRLYGANYQGSAVFRLQADDWQPQVFSDGFNTPNGLALHQDGSIYMADNQGNRLVKIAPNGFSSTFISNFSNPSGVLFEPGSDTLIATSYGDNRVVRITPDRKIIPLAQGGMLNGPVGLCYDDDGNLYAGNFNDRKIIRLDSDGTQHLVAQAPGSGWMGFINYAKGYIYGTLYNQHKIYRTDLEGKGEIILGSTAGTADGDASTAKFSAPNGIAISPSQDTIYISDYNTFNIRMLTNLDGTTSSKKIERFNFSEWQLYPNPAATVLNMELNLNQVTKITAKLFDQKGQLVEQFLETRSFGIGKHSIPLTIKNFPSGTYYVQVELDGKYTYSKAFLKS